MKKFTKLLVCSLLTLCFGMSLSAQTSADSATVIFQVDMNNVTTAFATPEVNGTFNGWCGNCWAMSDADGDNVWDVSGKVLKNTAHEFKFSADAFSIEENLFSGDACTVTNWGYTNRSLNVSGDTTLGVVCWESCSSCASAPSAYNVTFQVDMNGVSGFTTPEVNGTFNGWCGNCWAMSDADGDNVWDFTTLLAPGSYEYKFSADLWSIQESLDSNLFCVTTTIDTSLASGYASNRSFDVVASDLTLDVVPWNGCASAVVSGCTDATANNYDASASSDDGSCMYDVTFTVDLSCESFTPGYVAATGPSDGWSCGTYALTDGDANGVWEGTFSMPAGTFEYIYCADGWAQSEAADLLASGTASGDWSCTPATDYFSFANRLITVGAITTTDTWGTCGVCVTSIDGCTDSTATNYDPAATTDDGSCTYPAVLTITTTACDGASSVMMTGPWWGWDPTAGPVAVDNGDSTWTFTFNPAPTGDMEYLLIVDGVQEDLVTSSTASGDWSCTPVTDYWSYANRQWVVGSGDVTNTYGTCGVCVTSIDGCTDSTATNYDPAATTDDGSCTYPAVLTITTTACDGASSVMMTGPWWGWDPTAGPVAVDNGDSTWTFTFNPAPTGDMEYLLIVDGVQEDLVTSSTASGDWSCTPVTDYWSYANRQWVVGSGDVANTYNTCGSCVYGTAGCTDSTASNYDPSATTDDGSCTYCPQATVNFSVDAGAAVSAAYDNVVINGDFANWNGWGVTLLDPDGDGVYEGSLTVDAGSYEYVQALTGSGDGWSGWGVVGNAPAACEVAGTGNYGFTVTCGEVLTLPTVCFASCSACIVSVPGCTDSTATNYDALATVDDGSCTYPCLLDEVVLTMTDSYGDTWNGGTLTIDGVTYDQPTTAPGGASDTYTLCVDLSTCIDVIYSAGSYPGENSWSISDASGAVLASAGNVSGQIGVMCYLRMYRFNSD